MIDPELWRALTVRFPYSALIVDGIKPVENRAGGFPRGFRGWVLIHEALELHARWQEGLDDVGRVMRAYESTPKRFPSRFPGHYVGFVRLVDTHDAELGCCESEWAEQEYVGSDQKLHRGVTHLVFEGAHRFRYPMRDRGRLGLWRPAPPILDLLPLPGAHRRIV